MRELETEFGTVKGQNNLVQFITDYYTRLYSSDALALGTAEAQTPCWTSVSIKVTNNTNVILTRNLTLREIHDAI